MFGRKQIEINLLNDHIEVLEKLVEAQIDTIELKDRVIKQLREELIWLRD